MINIKKIPLSNMLLLEVSDFLHDIARIVGKHDPQALRLSDMYSLLLEQESNRQYLIVPYRGHHLTKKIEELHSIRLIYATTIFMQLRAMNKIKLHETIDLIKMAYPVAKDHLSYLRQNNRVVVYQTIALFFMELENNPDLMNAFVSLGFKNYLEGLENTNEECERLRNKRTTEKSKRLKVNKKTIAKEAFDVVRAFFDQVNQYQRSFKHLNYAPLINELNELLTEYSKLIKTRSTINKRRTNKKKAEDASTNEEESSAATKTSAQSNEKATGNLPAKIVKGANSEPIQNLMKVLKAANGEKSEDKT